MPFGPKPLVRTDQWTPAHRALCRHLKDECRGEERAETQKTLLRRLAEAGCPTTPREIFYLIRDLVLSGYPVGTSGKGVFWCIRRDEIVRARRYLMSRFDDLRARADALEKLVRRWGEASAEPLLEGAVLAEKKRTPDGKGAAVEIAIGLDGRLTRMEMDTGGQGLLFPTAGQAAK